MIWRIVIMVTLALAACSADDTQLATASVSDSDSGEVSSYAGAPDDPANEHGLFELSSAIICGRQLYDVGALTDPIDFADLSNRSEPNDPPPQGK